MLTWISVTIWRHIGPNEWNNMTKFFFVIDVYFGKEIIELLSWLLITKWFAKSFNHFKTNQRWRAVESYPRIRENCNDKFQHPLISDLWGSGRRRESWSTCGSVLKSNLTKQFSHGSSSSPLIHILWHYWALVSSILLLLTISWWSSLPGWGTSVSHSSPVLQTLRRLVLKYTYTAYMKSLLWQHWLNLRNVT